MSKPQIDLVGVLFLASVLLLTLVVAIAERRFVKTFKKKFPDIWLALGRPGSKDSDDWVRIWILKRGYISLNDSKFTQFCERVRLLMIFHLAYFGGGMLLILSLM